MISWLEGYLRAYRGTVIMVTHDRYFLDQVTNRILEISHGKMYSYDANYTTFLELKAQREEMELASERKRQSILRMELEWAKRGCRARTTKQKARLERLESLKNGSAPVTDDTITLDSVETRMGKKTMELHHVSKSYGEKVLVRDFSYTVLKNQKLGIIGPNGCGKSTLIRAILGKNGQGSGLLDVEEAGVCRTAAGLVISYMGQEASGLKGSVRDLCRERGLDESLFLAVLRQLDFERTQFLKNMEDYSEGQKKKVLLAASLATPAHLYIWDEPLNYIDVFSRMQIETLLLEYQPTMLFVEHDAGFCRRIATKTIRLDG